MKLALFVFVVALIGVAILSVQKTAKAEPTYHFICIEGNILWSDDIEVEKMTYKATFVDEQALQDAIPLLGTFQYSVGNKYYYTETNEVLNNQLKEWKKDNTCGISDLSSYPDLN